MRGVVKSFVLLVSFFVFALSYMAVFASLPGGREILRTYFAHISTMLSGVLPLRGQKLGDAA